LNTKFHSKRHPYYTANDLQKYENITT